LKAFATTSEEEDDMCKDEIISNGISEGIGNGTRLITIISLARFNNQ
jgi:hypothetical protein